MKIVMNSILTGRVNERDIDVTEEQLAKWRSGGLIQDVLSHLSEDDREFLISGATPEEWNAVFGRREGW